MTVLSRKIEDALLLLREIPLRAKSEKRRKDKKTCWVESEQAALKKHTRGVTVAQLLTIIHIIRSERQPSFLRLCRNGKDLYEETLAIHSDTACG